MHNNAHYRKCFLSNKQLVDAVCRIITIIIINNNAENSSRILLKGLIRKSVNWTNAAENKPNLPLEIKIVGKLYITLPMC